jgi:hypothetical protein
MKPRPVWNRRVRSIGKRACEPRALRQREADAVLWERPVVARVSPVTARRAFLPSPGGRLRQSRLARPGLGCPVVDLAMRQPATARCFAIVP